MKLLVPEQLETNRLILRRLRYEDAEEIFYSYASKTEATKHVLWPTHQSLHDTNEYLRYCAHAWESGYNYVFSLRLKFENRLIGSFGVVNDLGNIHFGYIISPTHWNKGYATEAGQRVIEELIRNQDIYRIWTFVDSENKASCQVLRKIGMLEEARLQNWKRFINQGDKAKDCIFFRYPLNKQ